MEKEEKNQRGFKAPETEFCLQWGNRKRLRCVRVKDPDVSSDGGGGGGIRRKITSRFVTEKQTSPLQPNNNRFTRSSEGAMLRSGGGENNRKSSSPEKEDRYYTTRGSVVGLDENGKVSMDGIGGVLGEERGGGGRGGGGGGGGGGVWPKLYISLSSKEKEEDFMAMKGCKLPQRPKKRAKIIQRSLLLVSPGAWLSDMCQERYEVREKKSSKKELSEKRPRGLKAMGGSMESDSE